MPIQANTIAFTHATHGVHCDTHNQILGLMLATGAEVLHIEKLLPEYQQLIETENSLVRRATAYVSTTTLKDFDELRDNAVGLVINVVNAYTSCTIEAKRKAALALDAMLAPYKGITHHTYRSETREVNGLISVLQSEAAAAHITTLGLTAEVDEIMLKNAEFDITMQQKQMEEAARTPQRDLSTEEVRAAVDSKYKEIIQVVNAYAVIQSTPEIELFIVNLNAILRLVEQDIARSGAKKKEDDPTEPTEPTDPTEPTTPEEPTPEPTPEA